MKGEYPLSSLNGWITSYTTTAGETFSALFFESPDPDYEDSYCIPFHDGPPKLSGDMRVWQKVSGETVSDLTLTPDYRVPDGNGKIHALIADGKAVIL